LAGASVTVTPYGAPEKNDIVRFVSMDRESAAAVMTTGCPVLSASSVANAPTGA
jgi:hypothetical protein